MTRFLQKTMTMIFCLALLLWDVSFALSITRGPYLADPAQDGMTIRWESDGKADYYVRYGTDSTLADRVEATLTAEIDGHFLYQARAKGLESSALYYYTVTTADTSTRIRSFKTAPRQNESIRFVVIGDSRSRPSIFRQICQQINKLSPDVVLSVGDMVGRGGHYDEWGQYYFAVAANVIDHIPFLSALGDHEGEDDDGAMFTKYFFPHKDNKRLWFSFDYGQAHFVALDYRHPFYQEMIEWFKKDMGQSRARWRFVYTHRPTYNFGGHRANWGDGLWARLYRQYRTDIVFAGHSHLYERFYPTRPLSQPDEWPVTYITTGGAGAPLYEVVQDSAIAFTQSVYHFVWVAMDKDRLTLKTLQPDGALLDSISFRKTKNGYSPHYMSLITPQENLDLHALFAGQISQDLERLPMKNRPAILQVHLKAPGVLEDVEFEIALADNSRQSYQMSPVRGVLKRGEELEVALKIYAKKTMTVSRWGDLSPELRIVATYTSRSFRGKVISKPLSYRDY